MEVDSVRPTTRTLHGACVRGACGEPNEIEYPPSHVYRTPPCTYWKARADSAWTGWHAPIASAYQAPVSTP